MDGYANMISCLIFALTVSAAPPDFATEIAPVLQERCVACHGPEQSKGGLRLHTWEAVSEGKVLAPGNAAESELYQRVSTQDPDERMPPKGAPLTPEQIAAIESWIAAGAAWDDAVMAEPVKRGSTHWSYRAPVQAAVPLEADPWVRNPVDGFVLAKLRAHGLEPSPGADRATLIRRLYLDLVGLPPEPEAVRAFEADTRPDAYERLVDLLLESPHFGEKQAIAWLDLARYADTNGYEKDRPRSVWPWRDWVIEAYNSDMPYDQFLVEQLAGDLLPGAKQDDRIATGFLRNSLYNEEGGVDVEEFRFEAMVDRVNTVATAALGMTLGCAQCHDHKYDPVSQREYYSFFAFLNNTDNIVMDVKSPEITRERDEAQAAIDARIANFASVFPMDEFRTDNVPLAPQTFETNGEATLEKLDDDSLLAGGAAPDTDRYAVRYALPSGTYQGLQLEALTHDSLPARGPGRAGNGNFALSTVSAALLQADGARERLTLARAEADVEQGGYGIAGTIDTDAKTAWAIDTGDGSLNADRAARFWFDTPLVLDQPAEIEVVLRHDHGGAHTLGRFRISGIQQGYPKSDLPETERREQYQAKQFNAWAEATRANARDWTVLNPIAYKSAKTATLNRLEDESILASGEYPNTDTYTVQFRIEQEGVTALRLEVLPHESLPGGGPGRGIIMSPEGDFFLSEVRARIAPWRNPDAAETITFGTPTASFAMAGRGADLTVDGQVETGWSINGGQGKAHYAVFPLAEPVPLLEGGTLLTLELEHFYVHQHTLGRFRVSATTQPPPPAPAGVRADVEALLLADAETWTDAERGRIRSYYLSIAPELSGEHAAIDAMRAAMPQYPTSYALEERADLRATHVHHRGEYLSPREPVQPATPEVLHEFPAAWPRNRLAFARWLVLPENPLLARVAVNRQWLGLFGRGIVETTEDFGLMASPPTHPELLDWLSVEFMRRGWSRKELLRLIVLSNTYRQASDVSEDLLARDPRNEWLSRGPRFRAPAEVVRDIALASGGLLSPKMGGPSVYPPLSPEVLQVLYTEGKNVWPTSEGEDRFRRGVYTFIKRIVPYPSAITFDMPPRDTTCPRRSQSNTPLQSLTLLNNSEFFVAAQAMAARVLQESAPDNNARLDRAFLIALSRVPDDTERAAFAKFIEQQQAVLANDAERAKVLVGEYAVEGSDSALQAAWVAACRALLNLDETISRT
ncbi:MAG: DUF1549 domain-containing protein [Candidatus Hydrogenedens sp.]|nr:DUF1549 domain-containing protein [Candidatus Hydrogenedens sp.]